MFISSWKKLKNKFSFVNFNQTKIKNRKFLQMFLQDKTETKN